MTPAQIKRRDALAEAFAKDRTGYMVRSQERTMWRDAHTLTFRAGYDAALADASVLVICLERLNVQAIVNGIEGQADVTRKIREALSAWRDLESGVESKKGE